jgi:macrolide transport system ATP-binding/permease protein
MAVLAALRAIGRNKLRAGLTMLGMFIGVAALIAMVAVGGARAAVEAQVQSLGTDLLVVLPGSTRFNGVRGGFGSASTLRVSDVGHILEEDGAVADVSYVSRQNTQIVNGNQNWSTSVQGISPSYLSIRRWPVIAGRSLTAEDDHAAAAVCLLGQTVLTNLFGDFSDPIGATVLVKNVPMTVIGVLVAKGHSATGQDQDDVVFIPFTTAQERILGVAAPELDADAGEQRVRHHWSTAQSVRRHAQARGLREHYLRSGAQPGAGARGARAGDAHARERASHPTRQVG